MDFTDFDAMIPADLDAAQSRQYELHALRALGEAIPRPQPDVLVQLGAIELAGSRPNTLAVINYRNRPSSAAKHPDLIATGPLREIAAIWEFADDPDDGFPGQLNSPPYVAYMIWSAFEASELMLADTNLAPTRRAPAVHPRLYRLDSTRTQLR